MTNSPALEADRRALAHIFTLLIERGRKVRIARGKNTEEVEGIYKAGEIVRGNRDISSYDLTKENPGGEGRGKNEARTRDEKSVCYD